MERSIKRVKIIFESKRNQARFSIWFEEVNRAPEYEDSCIDRWDVTLRRYALKYLTERLYGKRRRSFVAIKKTLAPVFACSGRETRLTRQRSSLSVRHDGSELRSCSVPHPPETCLRDQGPWLPREFKI